LSAPGFHQNGKIVLKGAHVMAGEKVQYDWTSIKKIRCMCPTRSPGGRGGGGTVGKIFEGEKKKKNIIGTKNRGEGQIMERINSEEEGEENGIGGWSCPLGETRQGQEREAFKC